MEEIKEAMRQHQEELAEQERNSVETIRLVGSKAASGLVKKAVERMALEFDDVHAMTDPFKQVRIFEVAVDVLTCRAEVQPLHGMP